MQETIAPARAIEGIIGLPGDKSISHRYAMLAAIAEGETTIANYSTGADCQSTLACVEELGATVERRKVANEVAKEVADDRGESGANASNDAGEDDGENDGQIIIAIRGG